MSGYPPLKDLELLSVEVGCLIPIDISLLQFQVGATSDLGLDGAMPTTAEIVKLSRIESRQPEENNIE